MLIRRLLLGACTSQAGAFQAVSEEFNRLGYALCSLSPDEMDAISEWMRDVTHIPLRTFHLPGFTPIIYIE